MTTQWTSPAARARTLAVLVLLASLPAASAHTGKRRCRRLRERVHAPHRGALILAAIVGAGVLLGSEAASRTTRQGFLAGAGIVCGVLYTTIVVAGLTVGLTQRWQRIGMRIVGSWIAAIALLVLSVAVKG